MNNPNYILLVFEGKKTEPIIFDNLKKYFLKNNPNRIIYAFHCGEIYSLYNKLQKDDEETLFFILKDKLKLENPELNSIIAKHVESIYLFFDYDGHADTNSSNKLQNMLDFFDDEFENGKLFVSYPMVEAVKHLKNGIDFKNTIEESKKSYKEIVAQNCNNNLQHLNKLTYEDWNSLICQHSKKANFIVNNSFTFPTNIIEQLEIFNNQKTKYIDIENKVAVLSAFPIFLLDYYGVDKFKSLV